MVKTIPIPGFSEPFSSLSHLLGAFLFVVLSVPLLRRGVGRTDRFISLLVFCFGAIFLLSMSGVYHMLEPSGTPRYVLRRLDHAAIFVLIACTFTPTHVILFRGWGRRGVLLLIWAIAIIGITLKSIYFDLVPPYLGITLYLGMGWIGLGTGIALWRRHGFDFIQCLWWGGVAYSVGGILEIMKWPVLIPGVLQSHEIFHVAVLIGLGFHWAFVYQIADGRLSEEPDA